jgi:hypothetical protein
MVLQTAVLSTEDGLTCGKLLVQKEDKLVQLFCPKFEDIRTEYITKRIPPQAAPVYIT